MPTVVVRDTRALLGQTIGKEILPDTRALLGKTPDTRALLGPNVKTRLLLDTRPKKILMFEYAQPYSKKINRVTTIPALFPRL